MIAYIDYSMFFWWAYFYFFVQISADWWRRHLRAQVLDQLTIFFNRIQKFLYTLTQKMANLRFRNSNRMVACYYRSHYWWTVVHWSTLQETFGLVDVKDHFFCLFWYIQYFPGKLDTETSFHSKHLRKLPKMSTIFLFLFR